MIDGKSVFVNLSMYYSVIHPHPHSILSCYMLRFFRLLASGREKKVDIEYWEDEHCRATRKMKPTRKQ